MHNFIEVGKWIIKENLKNKIKFLLSNLENERVIYAFSVNSSFKYIGICQSPKTTLKERMKRYQSASGGSTNRRISKLICNELENQNEVKIYALKPIESLKYNDIELDLVKGLEYPLIDKFLDEEKWNKY